jgi:hypothetical protein
MFRSVTNNSGKRLNHEEHEGHEEKQEQEVLMW